MMQENFSRDWWIRKVQEGYDHDGITLPLPKNEVIALRDGFYARVNGRLFGPWDCREYALAGLQTEIRRAERRFHGPEKGCSFEGTGLTPCRKSNCYECREHYS